MPWTVRVLFSSDGDSPRLQHQATILAMLRPVHGVRLRLARAASPYPASRGVIVEENHMRAIAVLSAVVIAAGTLATAQAPKRFNPMVELLAAKKPVFGLYAPSNRRFGGGGPGAPGGAGAARPSMPAPDAAPPEVPSGTRQGSGRVREQRLHFRRLDGRQLRSGDRALHRTDERHDDGRHPDQVAARLASATPSSSRRTRSPKTRPRPRSTSAGS